MADGVADLSFAPITGGARDLEVRRAALVGRGR
jgi:hypothetical protein